ncbi:hypothetical protein OUY22_14700 [Nonomuraea sp. MCN248]|uniref:Uncharacterized protein n=1 Tax=Nonomuraea corallina TaxID=2989783 RepID=A0ABT4SCG6_9ACTN|nr:hypothetical protein [Nonomuraea corallina]MDA0634670.1 hypothetical protein [Nonomuraea corallina]
MDAKEVRPRLWWIAAAWGVAVVCVVAGVFVFVNGVTNTVTDMAPTTTFAAGEKVSVSLDPEERPAVYIATQGRAAFTCEISGGPGQARLVNTQGRQTVTGGGRTWEQILLVNAPAAGDYQLTCAVQGEAGQEVEFGVGRDALSVAGGLIGGVAALLLIPGVGVLTAIVVTVVVLVRRRSHRRRLAAVG